MFHGGFVLAHLFGHGAVIRRPAIAAADNRQSLFFDRAQIGDQAIVQRDQKGLIGLALGEIILAVPDVVPADLKRVANTLFEAWRPVMARPRSLTRINMRSRANVVGGLPRRHEYPDRTEAGEDPKRIRAWISLRRHRVPMVLRHWWRNGGRAMPRSNRPKRCSLRSARHQSGREVSFLRLARWARVLGGQRPLSERSGFLRGFRRGHRPSQAGSLYDRPDGG